MDGTRGKCTAHFFLAKELSWTAKPLQTDIEACEVIFLSRSELVNAVQDGRICLLADIALYSLVLGTFLADMQRDL